MADDSEGPPVEDSMEQILNGAGITSRHAAAPLVTTDKELAIALRALR